MINVLSDAKIKTLMEKALELVGPDKLLPVQEFKKMPGYDLQKLMSAMVTFKVTLANARYVRDMLLGKASPERVARIGVPTLVTAECTTAPAVEDTVEDGAPDIYERVHGLEVGFLSVHAVLSKHARLLTDLARVDAEQHAAVLDEISPISQGLAALQNAVKELQLQMDGVGVFMKRYTEFVKSQQLSADRPDDTHVPIIQADSATEEQPESVLPA